MVGLATLPTEILLMIGAACMERKESYDPCYFHDSTKPVIHTEVLIRWDLLSLTYVNRRFNQTFNRLLYEFSANRERRYGVDKSFRRDNPESLKLFVDFGIGIHEDGAGITSVKSLERACREHAPRIAKWLLDSGATFQELVTHPTFPHPIALKDSAVLNFAFIKQEFEIAHLLLSYGATPYFSTWPTYVDDTTLETALHWAARQNQLGLIEYLIREKGVPVNQVNWKGTTPLFAYLEQLHDGLCTDSACSQDHSPKNFSDRRIRSNDCKEDITTLQSLINLGADVSFERRGELPLALALEGCYYDHANALLDAGAKVKSDKKSNSLIPSPIIACVQFRNSKHFRVKGEASRKRDMIVRLIERGIDINARDIGGHTPLEEAIRNGLATTVYDLTQLGASLHPDTPDGRDIVEFFMDKLYRVSGLRFAKAAALVRAGAIIDIPLAATGESLLMGMVRHFIDEDEWEPSLLEDILEAVSHRNMRFSHIHEVLERFAENAMREEKATDIACVTLIRHGARLRDPDLAFESAVAFLNETCRHMGHEDRAIFHTFLSIVPADRLDGVLEVARRREDNQSVEMVLERKAELQAAELVKPHEFD